MKVFLNVGCGHSRNNGSRLGFKNAEWRELRYDIDPSVQPDFVGSITDISIAHDQSIDAIYSSHNIEHLESFEVPLALNEFFRVLNHDGYCVITCPDMQSVAKLISDDKLLEPAYFSQMGPITPMDIVFGHRKSISEGKTYMSHRCGFTNSLLQQSLLGVGFQNVAIMRRGYYPYFDLWSIATKSKRSLEELRHLTELHFPK